MNGPACPGARAVNDPLRPQPVLGTIATTLGTPEAMTALIQGYLAVPDFDLRAQMHSYLYRLLEPAYWEGEEPFYLARGPWGRCRLDEASAAWCVPMRLD